MNSVIETALIPVYGSPNRKAKRVTQGVKMPARLVSTSSTRRREMLVVIVALKFVESNELMARANLNEIHRDMHEKFARRTGESEILSDLVSVLRANEALRHSFGEINDIVDRVHTGIELADAKLSYLIDYVNALDATADEMDEFFAPLSRFVTRYRERLQRFARDLDAYLIAHEDRARYTHEFRIAERASAELRERLSENTIDPTDSADDQEQKLRAKAASNFDHENARHHYDSSEKEVVAMARQMVSVLSDMKSMCQMATNADMRDTASASRADDLGLEDVFAAFTDAIHNHTRIASIGGFVIDHFRLVQRAYGLLRVDF